MYPGSNPYRARCRQRHRHEQAVQRRRRLALRSALREVFVRRRGAVSSGLEIRDGEELGAQNVVRRLEARAVLARVGGDHLARVQLGRARRIVHDANLVEVAQAQKQGSS